MNRLEDSFRPAFTRAAMTGRSFDNVAEDAMKELIRDVRKALLSASESGFPDMQAQMDLSHPLLNGISVRLSIVPGATHTQVSLRAYWKSELDRIEALDHSLVGMGDLGIISASQEDVILALSQEALQGYKTFARGFFRKLSESGVDLHAFADEALVASVMKS